MASYFIAAQPQADGTHAVHDRGRCPPGRFPGPDGVEYLGEFIEPGQALAVARLRFAAVRGCACCVPQATPLASPRHAAPAWPGWEPRADSAASARAACAYGSAAKPDATKVAPSAR